MGRSWQFFLTIAVIVAGMSYFYYASEFYAQREAARTARPAAETPSAASGDGAADLPATAGRGGILPSKE